LKKKKRNKETGSVEKPHVDYRGTEKFNGPWGSPSGHVPFLWVKLRGLEGGECYQKKDSGELLSLGSTLTVSLGGLNYGGIRQAKFLC